MNDLAQDDTPQQEHLNEAVTSVSSIEAHRSDLATIRERHQDALSKIATARETIHGQEGEIRKWREHLEYQERREQALRRRIISTREAIRSAEDEESGIY